MPEETPKDNSPIIGQHRVVIPPSVVQNTVHQVAVQGLGSAIDFSKITMHESHDAVRMGVPAFVQGQLISFAPGAFQPHSEAGRKLIAEQLEIAVAIHTMPKPVPIPYPNTALHASPAPFSQNVLLTSFPATLGNIPMPKTTKV